MKPGKKYLTVTAVCMIFICTFFVTVVQPSLFHVAYPRPVQASPDEEIEDLQTYRPSTSQIHRGYFNIHQNLNITQPPKTTSGTTTNPNRRGKLTTPTPGSTISTTQMAPRVVRKHSGQQKVVTSSNGEIITKSPKVGQLLTKSPKQHSKMEDTHKTFSSQNNKQLQPGNQQPNSRQQNYQTLPPKRVRRKPKASNKILAMPGSSV